MGIIMCFVVQVVSVINNKISRESGLVSEHYGTYEVAITDPLIKGPPPVAANSLQCMYMFQVAWIDTLII